MRKVVDKLVEERKYRNIDAYNKLVSMPYGIMDVKDYRNGIKLDKGLTEFSNSVSLNNVAVSKNMLHVNDKEPCKIIVHGKEFEVLPQIFMIIRGHILSAISCSEKVSQAYSDAVLDWFEGNPCRITEKQAKESIQNNLYFEAYKSLNEALKLYKDDISFESAISAMTGE